MATTLLIGMCLLAGSTDVPKLTSAQQAELARHFGFAPMQIYRLKPGIALLELADLDSDGRTDIALWNSVQSRFELFYQPDPSAPAGGSEAPLERNDIPNRGPMRSKTVPVAYRVAAMKVAELTGDGRPDLVFFGEPKELVILPGNAEGGFGPPVAIPCPEGEPRGGYLAVGDFNHDGRADVALLGREVLQVFAQKPEGGLGKPVRLVHGIQQPGLMLAADIDGDGRDDLAISADDEQYGLFVLLQDRAGALSALRPIRMPRLRSITFAKGDGGDHLLSVEHATGHLKQYRWTLPPRVGATPDWPQRLYSYPVAIKGKRMPVAVGDLTRDGLPDCICAAPDAAQLILFRSTADGLAAGQPFPGLLKTVDLHIADVDGDGHAELLSVSAEEKTLGVSDFADGRLTMPQPLPARGTPLAVAVGPLKTDSGVPSLFYAARGVSAGPDEEGKASGRQVWIRVVDPLTHNEVQSWACEELEDDPGGLRLADLDQDGRTDVVLLMRYSPPQVFLQAEDGSFRPLAGPDVRANLIREARVESFCLADVTGDGKAEVLVSHGGVARALTVRNGQWSAVDQYNPETAAAEITGVAALPAESGEPTVVLYDRMARALLVLRRRPDHAYAVAQTMYIGEFDLSAMLTLTVGQERRPALLLADTKRLALLAPGELAPTLVVQRSYETDIKDAWLGDAVVGDLNHDGIADTVAVDMRKANLEILTTGPDGDFVRALHFRVFEGKRFSNEPEQYGEPREVLVGEVTGDGIDDLVLIVHDRLIVYPGQ